MVVDYDFYKNTYGGTSIPSTAWARSEARAYGKVNNYTYDRLSDLNNVTDAVKMCICEVADCMYKEADDRDGIASVNTDGYSVTYNQTFESKLYQIVSDYLISTGLLYAGMRCHKHHVN